MSNSIKADLDKLVKRAAAQKTQLTKSAESVSAKADSAEDGTSPATTGEHAAHNKEMAAQYTAAAVDGGAPTNTVGKSVEKSTDGATAVATDGSEGSDTSKTEMGEPKKADNGTELPQNKVASVLKLAEELDAVAESLITKFDRFLIKAARASSDKQVKTAAEGMDDGALAGDVNDQLLAKIESGEMSDEEAQAILEEAVASGAIAPEEIQALAAEAGGEGGAPVDGGMPPAAPAAPEGEAELSPEDAARVEAAQVGPDSPEYMGKIASAYAAEMDAGYKFFMKLAEEIVAEQKEEAQDPKAEKAEGDAHEKSESKEEESAEHASAAAPAPAPVPATAQAPAAPAADPLSLTPANPEEAAALKAVQAELGLTDEQLAQLMAAPVAQEKVASAETRFRTAIYTRIASLAK
jgi:hypothetical protein